MGVFITAMGVVTPFGPGVDALRSALRSGGAALRPVTLFSEDPPLPVGQIDASLSGEAGLPRTHRLALTAAREALGSAPPRIDGVVLGGTTGGMHRTEEGVMAGLKDPEAYRCHGTGTVAELLADRFGCKGPVITVSTACSSGSAAIRIAMALIRTGRAQRVLAGGADSLCHLTYHGFHTLQLVDPEGARPFDRTRRGMSVAEAAAVVVLEAADAPPATAVAELLGGGLSCDAYHPTAPHPDGAGAAAAIRAALADSGISPEEIDYINLHGTGTPDNDRAEARAIQAVFQLRSPPASSVKGAMGHSLAASGAVEAVVCALALSEGLMPANTGCQTPDPEIDLALVTAPRQAPIRAVLSNAFGFGGNNAALLFGAPGAFPGRGKSSRPMPSLRVAASACCTGAGDLHTTMARLAEGGACGGILSDADVAHGLPPRRVRRLKRLSRMALSLGHGARSAAGDGGADNPAAIFWATGWGSLAETHDFLDQLFSTGKRFASPTDFVGSVHNAPAGQLALDFKSTGPNITTTGAASFAQALFTAALLAGEGAGPVLVAGADAFHSRFTPLFDPDGAGSAGGAEGGGALWVNGAGGNSGAGVQVEPVFLAGAYPGAVDDLVAALGGGSVIRERFAAVFAGIPAARQAEGRGALSAFLARAGFAGPVLDYRRRIGEFASAPAVAVALAVGYCAEGAITAPPDIPEPVALSKMGILVLDLGSDVGAVAVMP